MKEIQERKIVNSLESINRSFGRIAAYLQKITETKVDQLTVQGEQEKTEDDTD